jgi:hypothetical protein
VVKSAIFIAAFLSMAATVQQDIFQPPPHNPPGYALGSDGRYWKDGLPYTRQYRYKSSNDHWYEYTLDTPKEATADAYAILRRVIPLPREVARLAVVDYVSIASKALPLPKEMARHADERPVMLASLSAVYPQLPLPKELPIVPKEAPKLKAPKFEPKKTEPVKQPSEPPKVVQGIPENAALALAVADMSVFPPSEQPFLRWVWVDDNEQESFQAVVMTANYTDSASVPVRLFPVINERAMLARFNLRQLYPRNEDLNNAIKTWELLQNDPRFNLLLTADTLKFAAGIGVDGAKEKEKAKAKQKQVVGKDGKPDFKQQRIDDVVLLRVVSEHLDKGLVAALVQGTQSQAPVVSHSYYIARALTAIQDKGVWKEIFGGLYYDFVGIKTGAKVGTDEDALYESLGIGNVKEGITAQKIFDNLRSDQRVAVFRSGVTGKPRRVDVFKSLTGRDSQGLVAVTHDLKDQSIDVGQSPIFNLIEAKVDAKEVIFEGPNGIHRFALFDGNGKRQDEAPFDVALDREIPAPHSARLQPAVGCVRCHARDSGWRTLTNDVKTLLKGVNVFGDLVDNKGKIAGDADRIAGLYLGDLEFSILPRGRQDYNANVLRTIGTWGKPEENKDQTIIVKHVGDKIASIYNAYVYDLVFAKDVLRDFGLHLKDGDDAAKMLSDALPPVNVAIDGVIPESPRTVALKVGLGINRTDYALEYSFLATRYVNGLKK